MSINSAVQANNTETGVQLGMFSKQNFNKQADDWQFLAINSLCLKNISEKLPIKRALIGRQIIFNADMKNSRFLFRLNSNTSYLIQWCHCVVSTVNFKHAPRIKLMLI